MWSRLLLLKPMASTTKAKPKLKKKPVLKKPAVSRKEPPKKAISGSKRKKDINEKIQTLIARGQYTEEYNFDDLSPNEKYFCELFASDQEFFGNGTRAYIKAFNVNLKIPGAYEVAGQQAYRLLKTFEILAYINHVMEVGDLNDAFVDKQHAFLLIQNADLKTKMQAIKHYDVKKGRIIKKFKLDKHTHHHVTPEEAEILDEIFGADEDDD